MTKMILKLQVERVQSFVQQVSPGSPSDALRDVRSCGPLTRSLRLISADMALQISRCTVFWMIARQCRTCTHGRFDPRQPGVHPNRARFGFDGSALIGGRRSVFTRSLSVTNSSSRDSRTTSSSGTGCLGIPRRQLKKIRPKASSRGRRLTTPHTKPPDGVFQSSTARILDAQQDAVREVSCTFFLVLPFTDRDVICSANRTHNASATCSRLMTTPCNSRDATTNGRTFFLTSRMVFQIVPVDAESSFG